jgi:uncharacterized OB-fold protein
MSNGTVYTETVVHSAPEQFLADAPYQLVIVSLESGGRATARIAGARVAIGDPVSYVEHRNSTPYFEKAKS